MVMVWKSNLLGCDDRFSASASRDWSDKLRNEDPIPKAPLPRWGGPSRGKPTEKSATRRSADAGKQGAGQTIDAAAQPQQSTVILAGNVDNTPTVARGLAGQSLDSAPRSAPTAGRAEGVAGAQSGGSLINREQLPPALAGTLDHIIGQVPRILFDLLI